MLNPQIGEVWNFKDLGSDFDIKIIGITKSSVKGEVVRYRCGMCKVGNIASDWNFNSQYWSIVKNKCHDPKVGEIWKFKTDTSLFAIIQNVPSITGVITDPKQSWRSKFSIVTNLNIMESSLYDEWEYIETIKPNHKPQINEVWKFISSNAKDVIHNSDLLITKIYENSKIDATVIVGEEIGAEITEYSMNDQYEYWFFNRKRISCNKCICNGQETK